MSRAGVFLEAIILGDRGRMSQELQEELLAAGVYHLLAISGAHIGIIALLLLFFFKRIKLPFRSRYLFAALIILMFLILSGFKISAQRAVLMALLLFGAKIFFLDFNIYNIISFAGILLLIREPAQFLDAGFILTFTLTAAIVAGRRLLVPFFKEKAHLPYFLSELLSANLSASLIALPLSLFFFMRYSFTGLPAGLLLYPLTAIITALALILIPLVFIPALVSSALLTIAGVCLGIFFKITIFLALYLDWSIYRPNPSLVLVIITVSLFFFLSWFKKFESLRKTRAMVFFLFLISLLYPVFSPGTYRPANLEVYFMDVGQGDAQIVVFPGGDSLLIDGGGDHLSDFQTGKQILLPFILQKGIKIRWVAISHFHADHAEGIIEILPIIKPRELWISSAPQRDPYYAKLFDLLQKTGDIGLRKIKRGFTMSHKGITVDCLSPESFANSTHASNNNSQVLKISDGVHTFLFTGDIERDSELKLLTGNNDDLSAHILKVPHHGSRTSSSKKFLEKVKPELALFSYSQYNHFNFPHPQVSKTYKELSIPCLATAGRGHIKIISLPGRIEIQTAR